MKAIRKLIFSLLAVIFVALLIATPVANFLEVAPQTVFFAAILFNLVVNIITAIPVFTNPSDAFATGMAFGILSEIWLNQILKRLIPDGSYLMRSRDLAAYVSFNILHYAESGDMPETQIDNTVFPVPYQPRVDNPLSANLHYVNTVGTVVRDAEKKQLAYNKLEDVLDGHRRALYLQILKWITYQWSPQSNTPYTPVNATTGKQIGNAATFLSNSNPNYLAFTPGIFSMQKKLLIDMFAPEEQGRWVAILCTTHVDDLSAVDALIYKKIIEAESGKPIRLYNFDVYTTAVPAIFNASTGVKNALGSVGDSNNSPCSIFYYEPEMYRAMGDAEMFAQLNSPQALGDIVNFGQFFTGGSMRSKYVTAVYSGLAS